MEVRYDLLKKAYVRNIKEYNKKFIARQLNPTIGHRFMPYIVVVIDEYGDFIAEKGQDFETPIVQLAQYARAVGIHMIISTKRPTNDIITGAIKANFPTRIAFKSNVLLWIQQKWNVSMSLFPVKKVIPVLMNCLIHIMMKKIIM